MSAEDPATAWKQWHEHRVATVSAPYGPLALTGTLWLADYPEGRIPAVPGRWPAADGSVTVDLNGVQLPPCAFADHFVCPFPPPGNTLPFEIAAGERRLKGALASGI
ncbi:DUF1684 domain-containing protein [Streptomyces sp. AP-93]|nr:DUF1684 domain-containing protein [Streptomyces sp. AP-93]MCJ0874887.1 DUF1684 domain-containing protein [Streptomyces sp. AP-93]